MELIYLDSPLRRHPHAFKAAEAAACANDQGMFWDMHHDLFAHQSALAPDQLAGYAKEIELDVAAFQECLSSGRHAAAIREDIKTVQSLGINSTPAYLFGRRVPKSDKVEILEVFRGLGEYKDFEKTLQALLPPN